MYCNTYFIHCAKVPLRYLPLIFLYLHNNGLLKSFNFLTKKKKSDIEYNILCDRIIKIRKMKERKLFFDIHELPDDCLCLIFSFLDQLELANINSVSKHFNIISNLDLLWKKFLDKTKENICDIIANEKVKSKVIICNILRSYIEKIQNGYSNEEFNDFVSLFNTTFSNILN